MRFNEDLREYSDASRLPDLYQCCGEPVDPRLRRYIFDGEPCEYNEKMRSALKKYTFRDRIVNIFVMLIALQLILYTISASLQSEKDMSLFAFIAISVLVLLITVFACREYANNVAVKAADRGEVQCFRYNFYGISRYEISDTENGTTRFYYADLGDFLVKVSSDKQFPSKVIGLVINVKGTEHFYLLE
ncbi:MAG: hypothetical protein ACI4J0_06485 [Huintestinicola sp.]|uniref:hypothetical protein n=1 Tax=Huintestinicola sp. TaxID=2981661 RepID=UPI003EFD0BBA